MLTWYTYVKKTVQGKIYSTETSFKIPDFWWLQFWTTTVRMWIKIKYQSYSAASQWMVIGSSIFSLSSFSIRVIPQGTVDNNLWPDRLAGSKALYPNYCRQPTLWLHDLCLEVLTVHGIELRLFWAKSFPLLILLMSRIWHSSNRYNF